jgi:hypothetical protein
VNEFQERIGVGTTNYALGRTGPTRDRTVTAEEGSRKGKTAVVYTDHASGRVDAKVLVDPIKRSISHKVA